MSHARKVYFGRFRQHVRMWWQYRKNTTYRRLMARRARAFLWRAVKGS